MVDPAKIDEEFRRAQLLFFCRSGRGDADLKGFAREVDGWMGGCPLFADIPLPPPSREQLFAVAQRKGADGSGWREILRKWRFGQRASWSENAKTSCSSSNLGRFSS